MDVENQGIINIANFAEFDGVSFVELEHGNIIIEFPADESVIGTFRNVTVTESLTWILRGRLETE